MLAAPAVWQLDGSERQPPLRSCSTPTPNDPPAVNLPSLFPSRIINTPDTLTMPSTTTETLSLVEERKVSVAPLVLLSVVDHYNRGASTSSKNKRVVGVLLGQNDGKVVRVSNSFAG